MLALVVAACGPATGAENPPPTLPQPMSPSPQTMGWEGACPAPPRPAFLPWASTSGPRLEPFYGTTAVVYDGPTTIDPRSGDRLPSYFLIARAPDRERLWGTGSAPPPGTVRRAGTRAVQVYWIGDPGVGPVGAWWESGEPRCSLTVAHLLLREPTRIPQEAGDLGARIEQALIDVVASLTP